MSAVAITVRRVLADHHVVLYDDPRRWVCAAPGCPWTWEYTTFDDADVRRHFAAHQAGVLLGMALLAHDVEGYAARHYQCSLCGETWTERGLPGVWTLSDEHYRTRHPKAGHPVALGGES